MSLKNLERLQPGIRPAVEAYGMKLVSVLGSNLRSIALYGSAAGADFIPKRSNINILAVVERLDQGVLENLLGTVRWGKTKRVVAPLILTEAYIRSSLDVFPIEFSEIRDSQIVLFGQDFFSSIEVRPESLRLECESQIKAAMLRTRQAYLETGLRPEGAEAVLHTSMTSLVPVFRAMLRLKGISPPPRRAEVVSALGQVFAVRTDTFSAILRDKAGDERIGTREARVVLGRYLEDVEALADKMDQLKV